MRWYNNADVPCHQGLLNYWYNADVCGPAAAIRLLTILDFSWRSGFSAIVVGDLLDDVGIDVVQVASYLTWCPASPRLWSGLSAFVVGDLLDDVEIFFLVPTSPCSSVAVGSVTGTSFAVGSLLLVVLRLCAICRRAPPRRPPSLRSVVAASCSC